MLKSTPFDCSFFETEERAKWHGAVLTVRAKNVICKNPGLTPAAVQSLGEAARQWLMKFRDCGEGTAAEIMQAARSAVIESCENCRFYADCGDGEGVCQRFPPMQKSEVDGGFDFPAVVSVMWCGEWQNRSSLKKCATMFVEAPRGS